MPGTVLRILLACCVFIAFTGTGSWNLLNQNAAWSQENGDRQELSTDPDALKKLIDRINKLETEVDRLKKGDGANDAGQDGQIMAMLDFAHLGLFYPGPAQTRYVVLHVLLANTTKQPYVITRDNVIAEIDGEERKLREIPPQLQNYQIPYGKQ